MAEMEANQTGQVMSQEQMLQLLQQQHAEMMNLRARVEQQEAQNQQNRAQLMAAQEVACQRAVSITSIPDASALVQQNSFDTRTLGKPEPFKGTAEEFPDWVFIFKAYMG